MARPNLRPTLSGLRDYLGSVVIAVVLAPVLPDIAVDLFGNSSPQLDAALRGGTLAVIAVACLGFYLAQRAWAHRRSRRRTLAGIPKADVLVVPIGHSSVYHSRQRRTGPMSSLDWLIDATAPRDVVAVTSPEVQNLVDGHRTALGADGIGYRSVPISDARDPARTVAETDLVVATLRAAPFAGRRITVDTTGGSVPLSFMMLRVATQLGVACTYVSSEFANKQVVPGSQQGHTFDPLDLLGAAPAATAVATDLATAAPTVADPAAHPGTGNAGPDAARTDDPAAPDPDTEPSCPPSST